MFSEEKPEKRIYLDNSASTAVDERVIEAMNPFWCENMGNAGSLHLEGRIAKQAVEESRATVACALHTLPDTIIFTSSGTESNNMAVIGVVRERIKNGKKPEELHIITSLVEHNSVYDCCKVLEREGVRVTYIPVDTEGKVDIHALGEALTPDTVLVSFLYVNNEIGTIENVQEIARVVRAFRKKNNIHLGLTQMDAVQGARTKQNELYEQYHERCFVTGNDEMRHLCKSCYPLFHTDASQAFAWLPIDVQKLGVDLLTLDSQKIHGPKGVGCLFVREREVLEPMLYGGGQEFGLRPSTPPTPLIVGFAKALSLVEEERETYVKEVRGMRDWLLDYVLKKLPSTEIHGPLGSGRVAGNISFSFQDVDGEQLVIELDVKGIATSTKSACLSQDANESRVVQALQKENGENRGTLRITLSRFTTKEEIEKAGEVLVNTVMWLQKNH